MEFHNTYGKLGFSSWEFPDLNNGQLHMISDSDGHNFPFYGNSPVEVALISGPKSQSTLHRVSINDNFDPQISLDLPINSPESG